MAEKVSWTFAGRVLGGPTVARCGDLEVEAYVKLAVTIKKNPARTSRFFPVPAGGPSSWSSVQRRRAKADVRGGGEEGPARRPAHHDRHRCGGMLGNAVGTLKFENKTAQDADITIIAGRDATAMTRKERRCR